MTSEPDPGDPRVAREQVGDQVGGDRHQHDGDAEADHQHRGVGPFAAPATASTLSSDIEASAMTICVERWRENVLGLLTSAPVGTATGFAPSGGAALW